LEGTDSGRDRNIHTQAAKPTKTCGDVQSDVIVASATGEPRPRAVIELHFGELLQGPFGFVVEPIIIEEDANVAAGLAFGLSLAQPRSFFESDALKVLVLFQRAVEGRRVSPLLEDTMDFWVAVGDISRQGVGVKAIEYLFRTFVGKLHKI